MTVALLFTASCAKEDISSSIAGGEVVEVAFTANLTDLGTRAIGDGTTATTLYWYVYDGDELLTALSQSTTLTNKQAVVTLALLKGMKYDILFWADCGANSPYTVANKKVTVSYTGADANDEKRDAFYAVRTNLDPATATSEDTNIVLRRPFAQLNAYATDVEVVTKSGVELTTSTIKTKVYTTLNPFDGSVDGLTAEVVEFDAANILDKATGYLSMNYLLAPAGGCVADVEFVFNNDKGVVIPNTTYTNIPLKRNYRTNIRGKLLTKSTDFNVEIDASWGTPDEEVVIWDGKSVSIPEQDSEGNFLIDTGSDLAWLAGVVNGTISRAASQTFDGETFILTKDVELGGHEWTPIGFGSNMFAGTFDGNGKTISNFTVTKQEGQAGLFGRAQIAKIINLTVKNVTIVAHHYAGAIVGQGYVRFDNCHVENIDITLTTKNGDWGDKAGGIIGQNCEGTMSVKNSSAKNVTIKGYRDLGGIAGMAHNNNIVTGCSVENITIAQDLSVNYEAATPTTLGGVVGRKGSNVTYENNTEANVYIVTEASPADFADLLKRGGHIILSEGEYTFPEGNVYAGEVYVAAAEGANVVVNLPKSTYISGTKLTLEGLTLKVPAGLTYTEDAFGFIHHAAAFNMNNCVVEGGRLRLNVAEANIDECQFNITEASGFDGYGLFYYGKNDSTVNVSNSTFTGRQKAIVLYNEGKVTMNLNVENCTFTASETTDKAAISIHSEYGINGTVNITNSTATGFADFHGGLWRDVNNNTGKDNCNFTVTVDGQIVAIQGAQPVAGYPNLYKNAEDEYLIASLAGLKDWYAFLNANKSRNPYGCTVKLLNDIDAAGWTWNSLWITPDSGVTPGFTFDGQNKTISNLTVAGEGLVTGGVAGMTFKNLTVDGATVNSTGHNAAIFVGAAYSSVSFENVAVKNATVNGLCNTGIFVGGTYEPNNLVISFKNCSVETSAVKAAGKNGQDPTGASGFVGKAYSSTKLVFEGTNSIDDATTITNLNGLVGGKAYGYTTWANGGLANTGASDELVSWGGFVSDAAALTEALKIGGTVVLSQNVEAEAATAAPYGNKYGFKLDGGVLDGNDKELKVECYGDDYGIMTSGGTVKNLTIKEGCRAIMIMHPTEDIILDNVNFGGNGVLYPINTGEARAEGIKLVVTNSTLAGWVSFSNIASASFTNVKFEHGTYYNNIYGRVLKPYVNTTITDCSFIAHMNLDLSKLTSGHKITFKNCTVDGHAVNAGVFTVQPTDAQYDTELFTVDLPSWASSINDCIVFE